MAPLPARRPLVLALAVALAGLTAAPELAEAQRRPARAKAGSRQVDRPGHGFAASKAGARSLRPVSEAERRAGADALARRGQLHDGKQVEQDLRRITSDPRDATQTGRDSGYRKMARWAARRLQSRGVLPAGDGRRGVGRYFQAFAWDQRFASGARAESINVVGIRPGSGKHDEAILVVAHLDGLSKAQKDWAVKRRQVETMDGYQGANDNASAVTSLLYVSDQLDHLERTTGKALDRDVVFLITSAEEEGLKGAEAFARYARQFGDKRFVGVVNFEMVGRGDPNDIAVFGGLDARDAEGNPIYRRALDLGGEPGVARVREGYSRDGGNQWFTRSDHYPFARAGIDAVMYLGEATDYHTVDDSLERLDPRTNEAVAEHATRLVLDLAQRGTGRPGRTLPLRDEDVVVRDRKGLNEYGGKVYEADAAATE